MGLQAEFRSGLLFPSDSLASLASWRFNNKEPTAKDAKDAKVGFMELSRLCGYKALSKEY